MTNLNQFFEEYEEDEPAVDHIDSALAPPRFVAVRNLIKQALEKTLLLIDDGEYELEAYPHGDKIVDRIRMPISAITSPDSIINFELLFSTRTRDTHPSVDGYLNVTLKNSELD